MEYLRNINLLFLKLIYLNVIRCQMKLLIDHSKKYLFVELLLDCIYMMNFSNIAISMGYFQLICIPTPKNPSMDILGYIDPKFHLTPYICSIICFTPIYYQNQHLEQLMFLEKSLML